MFLLVKSVGVTGDGRRYDYVVSLRVVETVDFMMAGHIFLLTNYWKPFLGVFYDISSKPSVTIG